jgi:hypothetical protein
MSSPYSTGGGGTHLEARIVASAMAAVLCEAPFRGLVGDHATRVRTQRATFNDPLDDLIVDGVAIDGRGTKLDLQIKNKLSFSEGDAEWTESLQRAWNTFSNATFDPVLHRVGVGTGSYNARVDQHYQSVLVWAEHSPDAADFLQRMQEGHYSHKDKQSFVTTIRTVLTAHAGRALTDQEFWRFLKCLVIVHFDFQAGAGSRDEAMVIERLRAGLAPAHRGDAQKVWDHLVAGAGELGPVGGGATRATLADQLTKAGFNIGSAPSSRNDIRALQQESLRALAEIRSNIQGLKLHRATAHEGVRAALSEARFVQVDGEPGTGKSAVLKGIAEESARNGPVLVLKDSRIHAKGWSAHAHVLGVSADISELLREFGCAGEPILFIDGIDKISELSVQLTVNDVLTAIASDETLAAWRVLVTVREQNLKHLQTWLDPDAIRKLRIQTVTVGPLSDDELNVVADRFPQLSPLLNQAGGSDVILRRPFFINALLALTAHADGRALPATEVELLKLWWEMGGSDQKDFVKAQHRRNTLLAAANLLSQASSAAIAIHTLLPEPLDELKSAGVLRGKELGHSVVFGHDIYEEWALCELLISRQDDVVALLQQTGEPVALIRPMQLLGAYMLETNDTVDAWKALLGALGNAALRPVWQRALLTSCVQSTRTTLLLGKLKDVLLENSCERLKKLLLAMSTIEVMPNPTFLSEKLTPDLAPDERARYAHLTAVPKPMTWVRFLDWLMPQVAALPPTLIADLLPVFKTWMDSFAGQKVRHCREIGTVSYGWLKELEAAFHPAEFRDYRQPFGGALSGRDLEKPIRALFLSAAGDVPSLARDYLNRKVSERKQVHMFRDEIVKNSVALSRHLPSELVDFILAAFLEDPDEKRDPFGSYSHHVFDELGVAGHQSFYPASPIQQPFLALLRLNRAQGLRLIRGLCNHSIAIWRKMRERGLRYSDPVTPMPVKLSFPWGEQTFWGDEQVYLWFRGIWGAVESGLMALEQWALEEIDKGAAFEEIFRAAVEGNNAVAALGIAVSLCLARPGTALDCAFPLVTCTYLWQWDMRRVVQEATPTNTMGNWFQDRLQLSAVRTLNERPHRKNVIRDLVPYFVFAGDKALVKRFAKSVRGFPKRLPVIFKEEKQDADHLASLREQMVLFSEQADPKYWHTAPTEEGKHIQFWNDPASLKQEKYKERQEQHLQLNQYLGVATWATKSLESDSIDNKLSLDDALAKARSWDASDLFDTKSESFEQRHRGAAVAGAAFVAARHCPPDKWNDDLAQWCMQVLDRAATGPETEGDLSVRSAVLLFHPAVFAAHGYSALLARGYAVDECRRHLLSLAVDVLQNVQVAVFAAAKYYATTQPTFYRVLFDLAMQQCVVDRDAIPDFHSIVWSEAEATRKLALLERAQKLLAAGKVPTLPTVPMPWVQSGAPRRTVRNDTKGYARNDTVFMWDLAGKILPHAAIGVLTSDPAMRAQFLKLVSELLEMTLQEIRPPFVEAKRDHHGNTPFEWVYDFARWSGKVSVHLAPDEVKEHLLSKIWSQDGETAFMILQGLMLNYMINAFLNPKVIDDRQVALWGEMTDRLLQSREWTRGGRSEHIDREFAACAFATLFCAAPDFSPLICGIDPGWLHLQKFVPVIEKAIRAFGLNATLYLGVTTLLKRGGVDLLPDPALPWLQEVVTARRSDQKFWKSNGEDTVEVLKLLISQKGAALTTDHRRLITSIADVLSDNGVRGAGFLQQELLRQA